MGEEANHDYIFRASWMVHDHSSLIEIDCLYIDLLTRLLLLRQRRMIHDIALIVPFSSESMLIFRAVTFLKCT